MSWPVTSWPCDELTVWRVDCHPKIGGWRLKMMQYNSMSWNFQYYWQRFLCCRLHANWWVVGTLHWTARRLCWEITLLVIIIFYAFIIGTYWTPLVYIDFALDFVYKKWHEIIRVRPILWRRPIPDTIGCSYTDTDTDTWLYKFFVLKMRFGAGYRCVQVIYVCGIYARKYGIDLKL